MGGCQAVAGEVAGRVFKLSPKPLEDCVSRFGLAVRR